MGHLSTSVIEHFQRELSNYIISRQHYELILDSVGNVLLQGSKKCFTSRFYFTWQSFLHPNPVSFQFFGFFVNA
jgi:hypothetical protein